MNYDMKVRRYSQDLRRNMTREERHLWYDFLKRYPVQFKRQFPIGKYIVDFYCYQGKLIIELDGSQHCEASAIVYDRQRTAYLEEQGFCVLRYSNLDVMNHFREVCESIDSCVQHRISQNLGE